MWRLAQGAALVLATLGTGLFAGLLYGYACSVMPGLRGADDRTVIDVMQRINVAILNPVFALSFAGGPGFTLLALLAQLHDGRPALAAVLVAALALDGVALAITARRNIALNNALAAAGPAATVPDPAAVRHRFERPWVRWNIARTLAASAAFGCLCAALVLHGGTG